MCIKHRTMTAELTAQDHYDLSVVYQKEGNMLDGVYHRLMYLEKIHNPINRDDLCIYWIYTRGHIKLNPDEYIFMITETLTIHPEYSYFWRFLGHLHYRKGNLDSVIQCYRKSITLGNIGCIREWMRIYGNTTYPDELPTWDNNTDFAHTIIDVLQHLGSLGNTQVWTVLSDIFRYGYCGMPQDRVKADTYQQALTAT